MPAEVALVALLSPVGALVRRASGALVAGLLVASGAHAGPVLGAPRVRPPPVAPDAPAGPRAPAEVATDGPTDATRPPQPVAGGPTRPPLLVVATTPPSPSVPPEPRPEPGRLGFVGVGLLAPSLDGARSAASSRLSPGVTLVSIEAHGWRGSGSGEDGELLRLTERLVVLDLPSRRLLPFEVTVEGGYRWSLDSGSEHHLYVLGGGSALVSVARQHRTAYLHLPRVSAGYHWYSDDVLVEIGPSASLALMGRSSVALGDDTAPWTGAPAYYLRPVTGAQASVATRTNMISLGAHRTWLAGSGHVTDHLTGLVCHSGTATRESGSGNVGGCLVSDVFHDRFASVPETWSYQAHLDLFLTFTSGL